MSIVINLNDTFYQISFTKFYNSSLLINIEDYHILCLVKNKCMILIENPRTNIQYVHSYFEFFFEYIPESYTLGQIKSNILIIYNLGSNSFEYSSCILFTKGFLIKEILIYLPTREISYLRELKYFFYPHYLDICNICLEENKKVINVHNDKYHHTFCLSCLLQLYYRVCPLCRKPIE